MIKRLAKLGAVQWLAAALVVAWIKFVYATSRHSFIGLESIAPIVEGKRPAVACCWHARMMMMRRAVPDFMPFAALVSGHRDGQLVGRAMSMMGVRIISGSSTRGGHGAIRQGADALANGYVLVITPDGPRGPASVAAPGAVEIARLAQAPIVPVSYASNRARRLPTWDGFLLPLPFARAVFVFGAPLDPPSDADAVEAVRLELQTRLIALDAIADAAVARQSPAR